MLSMATAVDHQAADNCISTKSVRPGNAGKVQLRAAIHKVATTAARSRADGRVIAERAWSGLRRSSVAAHGKCRE
ncbi:hypothetical protein GCM10007856_27020 [Azospirillum oryzae]|nr:hypothetical protein GCM10007856_27020 [Azospirillum oryzae]